MSIGSQTVSPPGQRCAGTHSSTVSPSTGLPAGRHSVSGSATPRAPHSARSAL